MHLNSLETLKEHVAGIHQCLDEITAMWRRNQELERRLKSLEKAYHEILKENQKLLAELMSEKAHEAVPADHVMYRSYASHPLLKRLMNIKLGVENLHTEEKLDQEDLQWLMKYFFNLEEFGKVLIEQDLSKEWFNEMINNILVFLVQFRTDNRKIQFHACHHQENKMVFQFLKKLWIGLEMLTLNVLSRDPRCSDTALLDVMALQRRIKEDSLPHFQRCVEIVFEHPALEEIARKYDEFESLAVTPAVNNILKLKHSVVEIEEKIVLKGSVIVYQDGTKEWQGWRKVELSG